MVLFLDDTVEMVAALSTAPTAFFNPEAASSGSATRGTIPFTQVLAPTARTMLPFAT